MRLIPITDTDPETLGRSVGRHLRKAHTGRALAFPLDVVHVNRCQGVEALHARQRI
jgi:hypothetical protein